MAEPTVQAVLFLCGEQDVFAKYGPANGTRRGDVSTFCSVQRIMGAEDVVQAATAHLGQTLLEHCGRLLHAALVYPGMGAILLWDTRQGTWQ